MERFRLVHDVTNNQWLVMDGSAKYPTRIVYYASSQVDAENFWRDYDGEDADEFEARYRNTTAGEPGDFYRRQPKDYIEARERISRQRAEWEAHKAQQEADRIAAEAASREQLARKESYGVF